MQKRLIYDRIEDKKENVLKFFNPKEIYYGYYSMVGIEDLK